VLFEEACDATPNNTALIGPSHTDNFQSDFTLTYSQVEARANQICHYLITQGVVPGDNVSIFLERSVDFYISMLAVLKAGGCYVPLDPEHPNDRLTYILEDSNAKLIITTEELGNRLSTAIKETKSTATTTFVCLDRKEDSTGIKSQTTSRPVVEGVHNQLLCYILYTSGSTGKPKGVQIIHENVINLMYGEEAVFRITSKDRILQGYTQVRRDSSSLTISPPPPILLLLTCSNSPLVPLLSSPSSAADLRFVCGEDLACLHAQCYPGGGY